MKWIICITISLLLVGCVMPLQKHVTPTTTPNLYIHKKRIRRCVHITPNAISQNDIPIVNLMASQGEANE